MALMTVVAMTIKTTGLALEGRIVTDQLYTTTETRRAAPDSSGLIFTIILDLGSGYMI